MLDFCGGLEYNFRMDISEKTTLRKKIDLACTYAGISQAALARALGVTPATFNARLKTCKFSPDELDKIAQTLGAVYSFAFEFPDGTRI